MDGPAPPETGGSGEGKGAGSGPRTAAPPALQTGLQFLTEDFLRFWMVDIRRRVAARHRAQAPDRRGQKLRLGPWRGEGAPNLGRVRLTSSCSSGGEGTKRRCCRVHAFVEDPKTGTARKAGPAPCRAAGSLSSVDGESSNAHSLQGNGASKPEQETTSARLCQALNRRQTEAK